MAHPCEYDFRGRAKVNQNTWRPEEFQGARYGDPPTTRREDHPRGPRQLSRELELEGPKGRLPFGTEELGNRASLPPFDLLVEVQEAPPQRLRHCLPHRGLPRAREPGKDQVRGGRRVQGGHSGERGLVSFWLGPDYSNGRDSSGGECISGLSSSRGRAEAVVCRSWSGSSRRTVHRADLRTRRSRRGTERTRRTSFGSRHHDRETGCFSEESSPR